MIQEEKAKKRSVHIAKSDIRVLKKLRKEFDNDEEFAGKFGITRTTLRRIMELERGSEENITKIKTILND